MTPEIPSTVYKSKPAHERVSYAVGFLWSVLFFLEYALKEKCIFYGTYVVEPHHTVTSLWWPLSLPQHNGHTFSYTKPSLMRSPINAANDHILKSQIVKSFLSQRVTNPWERLRGRPSLLADS